MKNFMLLSLIMLSSCASIDVELEQAIAFGEITEVNDYSESIDKNLYIRLYRSPIYKEDCFIETHDVCQFNYFISVSTYDEYPDTAIYNLTENGEITDIKWIATSEIDTAIVEFSINSYTSAALKNNSSLEPMGKLLMVKVTPTKIEQSLIKQR